MTLRLVGAVADKGNKYGGHAAHREHGSPSIVRADQVIQRRRDERANVETAVQKAGSGYSPMIGHLFRDENRFCYKFTSDSKARQYPEETELPYVLCQAPQER